MSRNTKAGIFGAVVGFAIAFLTDLTIFQWQFWVFMIIISVAGTWYASDRGGGK